MQTNPAALLVHFYIIEKSVALSLQLAPSRKSRQSSALISTEDSRKFVSAMFHYDFCDYYHTITLLFSNHIRSFPTLFSRSTITSALLLYVTDRHPCEEEHPFSFLCLLYLSSDSHFLSPLFQTGLNGSRRLLMISKRLMLRAMCLTLLNRWMDRNRLYPATSATSLNHAYRNHCRGGRAYHVTVAGCYEIRRVHTPYSAQYPNSSSIELPILQNLPSISITPSQ